MLILFTINSIKFELLSLIGILLLLTILLAISIVFHPERSGAHIGSCRVPSGPAAARASASASVSYRLHGCTAHQSLSLVLVPS